MYIEIDIIKKIMENVCSFIVMVTTVSGFITTVLDNVPEVLMGIQSYKAKKYYKYKIYFYAMIGLIVLQLVPLFCDLLNKLHDISKLIIIVVSLFMCIMQTIILILSIFDWFVKKINNKSKLVVCVELIAAILSGIMCKIAFENQYEIIILCVVFEIIVIMPVLVAATPWLKDYETIARFICVDSSDNYRYLYYDDEKGHYICGDDIRCDKNERFYIVSYQDVKSIEKVQKDNSDDYCQGKECMLEKNGLSVNITVDINETKQSG